MVHSFISINMGNQLTNSCTYKIKLSATTFEIKTRKKQKERKTKKNKKKKKNK
jgi:anaerobic C4-dicarboxylate transporter